ncbi:hypothetical protein [Rhabdochromatium marinum]|uniref:hypothetical protein n=1 Tax=Rhabdochromatium marinum TaxID=48729 RepID=UPI001907A631|nr:hypothetical protein [Rhabdochromatium marinum]MBK1647505.1 hypothetical protein [Rhabdochromatium marinum]
MRSLPYRFLVATVMTLPLSLTGCASGGFSLFEAAPGAHFSGVSEQRVMARIERFCADYSIGEQPLGSLLEKDAKFRTLTHELYRGEMSNDEYVARVLTLYPAADGNVPATGCVITQFNDCISGDCQLKPSSASQAPVAEAEAEAATETIVAMPDDGHPHEMSATPKLKAEL